MYQTSIEFFWPLTEQIALPLDYSECDTKPKLVTGVGTSGQTIAFNGATGSWVTTTASNIVVADVSTRGLTIDSGTITIKGIEMPWYRKLVFKLMGFKWNG